MAGIDFLGPEGLTLSFAGVGVVAAAGKDTEAVWMGGHIDERERLALILVDANPQLERARYVLGRLGVETRQVEQVEVNGFAGGATVVVGPGDEVAAGHHHRADVFDDLDGAPCLGQVTLALVIQPIALAAKREELG